jgi:hypothetical protein
VIEMYFGESSPPWYGEDAANIEIASGGTIVGDEPALGHRIGRRVVREPVVAGT